jgi:hypothetical protein
MESRLTEECVVAIFYVLPPSPLVADHLADYLGSWLPGLDWDEPTRLNLTEAIRAAASCRPDVYLVFREELPEGVATTEALIDAFGAEHGDVIIEVRSAFHEGYPAARRWQIRDAA